MNHQPLSASFVLGWASLNSAELSRSGRAVISIQLAWLTGPAGREVLCTGLWVKPLAMHDSALDFLLCPIEQVSLAIVASQVLGGHSGQDGSSRKGFVSPGPQQGIGAADAASERKTVPHLQEASPRDTQPRLHLARCWATPCQDCTAEEEGGAWAGPGAAGARLGPSAHGKECSFLRRPAQRVPPATPWHCRVQPYSGWGLFTAEAAGSPSATSLRFAFVHRRVPRKPGCEHANLEVSRYQVTQGTNYPRPAGVAHHASSSPSPLPRLTPYLDAHSSEAQVRRAKSGMSILCKNAPPPSRSLQTPRAAHTHRLASSPPTPPAPQHLSPGMPWEVQRASLCRRCCWIKRKMLS